MIVHSTLRNLLRALALGFALLAVSASAAFGAGMEFSGFEGRGVNADGSPSTEAGARPSKVINNFKLKLLSGAPLNIPFPSGNVKDIDVELPPGFVGNAASFPHCKQEELAGANSQCLADSQVGTAMLRLRWSGAVGWQDFPVGVFNMEPPPGVAAEFGFRTLISITYVDFYVRSGDDYGVTAKIRNVNEGAPVMVSDLEIWGVPGDPSHDELRVPFAGSIPAKYAESPPVPYPLPAPYKPLLSNPTSCGGPLVTTVAATSWQDRDEWVEPPVDAAPGLTGCEDLQFNPAVDAQPSTQAGDSPAGFDFNLHVPQSQDSNGKAIAHLRDSTVVLPPSLTVNPSSANGLAACDVQQIGFLGTTSEKQAISYDPGAAEALVFTYGGESSAPIPGSAGKAEVTTALQTLPGLAGNISLSGGPGGWVVAFGGALSGTDVPEISGTLIENSSQTVTVTGTAGGFNLQYEGAGTGATYEAGSFEANASLLVLSNASAPLKIGEWLEGPGLAPGTKVDFASNFGGVAVALISPPTTSAQSGVEIRTAIPFDATPAALRDALQAIPALEGKVAVARIGTVGDTRTYKVYFDGSLGEPALLTATNSLAGEGAGATVAQGSKESQPITSGTTQEAGAPKFTPAAANCPPAAEIGSVEIDSPAVVDHTLKGSVFLAKPHENPFNSLLAMYITVADPQSGVVVKLPGRIDADPRSGQLTATVSDAPQLPFEDLRLSFFSGAAAPLKTGIQCGVYDVTTEMVSWSGAAKKPGDSFPLVKACYPNEGAAPNTPSFEAGTVDPAAGTYSPFVLKLSRPDGTQQLSGIDTNLPKGLLARLAGTPYCSDSALAAAAGKAGKAEQASPSCPAASRVGSVNVGAGAGPKPFYAGGVAYLAGPYKGAPLSLAVVVPAVAGPFDLGTVVVRNALYVNPETTVVRAVSDPFPTILQGIPLDLRSVVVNLDKSEFTKNPTSCNPLAITGALATLPGQSAALNQPFQAASCGKLKFGPKLTLSLAGQTKRSGNPAVTAVLTAPQGEANIADTTVILPTTAFIDNDHVNNPCTREQFAQNACPSSSILGTATASTPLLDQPLSGKVYFRSNGGARELPDMVVALDGQIPITLVGFIDSIGKKGSDKRRVRTRFLSVPDAPVSKFVLKLYGGKRGLIENSANLCQRPGKATVQMTGQNGKTKDFDTPFTAKCGKKGKAKRKG